MRRGFSGGLFLGALIGTTLSFMAEENFRVDRTWKAMNKAGKNIGRKAGRMYSSIKHMI